MLMNNRTHLFTHTHGSCFLSSQSPLSGVCFWGLDNLLQHPHMESWNNLSCSVSKCFNFIRTWEIKRVSRRLFDSRKSPRSANQYYLLWRKVSPLSFKEHHCKDNSFFLMNKLVVIKKSIFDLISYYSCLYSFFFNVAGCGRLRRGPPKMPMS